MRTYTQEEISIMKSMAKIHNTTHDKAIKRSRELEQIVQLAQGEEGRLRLTEWEQITLCRILNKFADSYYHTAVDAERQADGYCKDIKRAEKALNAL